MDSNSIHLSRHYDICTYMRLLSHVWLFVTPCTEACQAPLFLQFFRQEYWSGLPFPSLGNLPSPGMEPVSPALAGRFFTTWATTAKHYDTYECVVKYSKYSTHYDIYRLYSKICIYTTLGCKQIYLAYVVSQKGPVYIKTANGLYSRHTCHNVGGNFCHKRPW